MITETFRNSVINSNKIVVLKFLKVELSRNSSRLLSKKLNYSSFGTIINNLSAGMEHIVKV